MVSDQESRERMQSGQPRVARGDAIVAFRLQMTKKSDDALGGEIIQGDGLYLPARVLGRELQQQQHGVAVAANGMRAHSSLRREILLEEAEQGARQIGGQHFSHKAPPFTSRPNCCSKRRLARRRKEGTQCR